MHNPRDVQFFGTSQRYDVEMIDDPGKDAPIFSTTYLHLSAQGLTGEMDAKTAS
jgi:hypothetical protein